MASQGTLGRFKGAIAAAVVMLLVGGGWLTYVLLNQEPEAPSATPQIFTFEKDDLRGIKVVRPDETIEFVKGADGEWEWVGKNWRPSSSMVRRIGHQTHDLVARAAVADAEDLGEYGCGEDALRITLTLDERDPIVFDAGDPNPTSVSWYLCPTPGDTVYVVQKAAVDYWRMEEQEFRERRFASFEADEAVSIDAVVDGRTLAFRRVNAKRWQQSAPIEQAAGRQAVRTMLGRTSALKASEFVEDAPQDLAKYGLDEPKHTITIRLDGGEVITLHVGDIIPGSEPQERYIFRVEDDAVYAARDGFIEAFLEADEDYRDPRFLYIDASQIRSYTVHSERYEPLTIRSTPDGWRWPDDSEIGGMTPRRVAASATDPSAVAFIDEPDPAKDYGFDKNPRFVEVEVEGRPKVVIRLGEIFDRDDNGRSTPAQYLQVEGDPVVYVVNDILNGEITSLLNEYRRKLETDDEKGLLEDDTDTPVAP